MKIISRVFSCLAIMTAFAVIMVPSVHSQLTYTLTELSLGGTWGTAVGLNEGGQVTGRSQDAQGHGQAFIYDPITGIQEISLDGTWSGPFAIGETHAFLYDPTQGLQDLNDVVSDPKGFVIRIARFINERGEIVAEASNSERKAYQPVLIRLQEVP